MNGEDIRLYLNIAASCTTLLAFIGIGFGPIRRRVSKWMGELFTVQVRTDMNAGFAKLSLELTKDRGLSTKRHRANTKELRKIAFGLQVNTARIDDHEEGHP